MIVIFLGIFSFLFGFAVHILFWRFLPESRRLRLLIPLFVLSFCVFISLIYFIGGFFPVLEACLPRGIYSFLHISLLFLLLTAGYFTTYPAIEIDSPSLALVYFIHCSGKNGFDKQRLEICMGDDVLILPRIDDLVRGGLVMEKDGHYLITGSGKMFIKIFISYRRLMGLPKGG